MRHTAIALFVAVICVASALGCEQQRTPAMSGKESFTSPPEWKGPAFGSLAVNLSDGAVCEIRLRVSDPIGASIDLTERVGAISGTRWNIEVRSDSANGPTIEPVSTIDHRPYYRLQAGVYSVLLKPLATAARSLRPGERTHNLSFRDFSILPIPQLSISGLPKSIRLDRYTYGTQADFKLSTRSQLCIRLTAPKQWPKSELDKLGLTASLREEQNLKFEPTSVARDSGSINFYFLLNSGSYRIYLAHEAHMWPKPVLPPEISDYDLSLRITELSSHPIPVDLQPLDSWIGSLGLKTKLEVFDIYNPNSISPNVPSSVKQQYKKLIDQISRDARALIAVDKKQISGATNASRKPEVLVLFRTSRDREEIEAIEDEFQLQTNSSFWDHALRKVALMQNLPTFKVAAYLRIWCSGGEIFESMPGVAGRYGKDCTMGSAKQQIQLPASALAKGEIAALSRRINMGELFDPFLKGFLPAKSP
jgi:hypothetical protein